MFSEVVYFCVFQIVSDFILESERESFIEQVREVIEMADEKGEGIKDGFPQVFILRYMNLTLVFTPTCGKESYHLIFSSLQLSDHQQQPELSVPMLPGW